MPVERGVLCGKVGQQGRITIAVTLHPVRFPVGEHRHDFGAADVATVEHEVDGFTPQQFGGLDGGSHPSVRIAENTNPHRNCPFNFRRVTPAIPRYLASNWWQSAPCCIPHPGVMSRGSGVAVSRSLFVRHSWGHVSLASGTA